LSQDGYFGKVTIGFQNGNITSLEKTGKSEIRRINLNQGSWEDQARLA